MNNPSGYTALDLVGFTDRGTYDPNYNYVANDLAHHGGSIWCCLIDDTVGITPTEGVNWRFWVEDSQNGISDIVNVLGAKNLLKIETNNATSNSVRLTVNDDGSLTINGTATPSSAYFVIMNHDFGNYRFATDGNSNANAQYILSGLAEDPYLYMTYDTANKRVALILSQGHTADNVTIYPMIRPKNIEDDTWQPYTKTNQELTEEVTQNSSDIQTLTNNVSANATAIAKCETLVVSVASFSALPQTITNANIEDDMVVVNSVLSNPSAQTGDWTVTTSNGSLTISGSISGTTTATLYLMKSR